MRTVKSLSLLFLGIAFIAASCTKEGPEGPVGSTGPQGPAGVAGPAGPAGPSGGALYSTWVASGAANWVANVPATSGSSEALAMYRRAAAGITQAILDNGVVLCYMKLLAANQSGIGAGPIYPLPYTYVDDDYEDHYDFSATVGFVTFIYKTGTSAAALTATQLGAFNFRYVLIPGTGLTGRSGQPEYAGHTKAELLKMSYEEVSALLNLPASGSNIK